MRTVPVVGVVLLAALLMAGCQSSSSPSSANNAAAPAPSATPQTVTAKAAFWPMYHAAHSWAPDAAVFRLTAKPLSGFTNDSGKAAMWEAVFASATLHQYRNFTYSIAAAPPQTYAGVTGGLAMPWGGETRDAMAIDTSRFNVDSDAAWKAASSLAADWLKKNPQQSPAALELGENYRYPEPVWYVQWGDKKSGYAALVSADTGKSLNRK